MTAFKHTARRFGGMLFALSLLTGLPPQATAGEATGTPPAAQEQDMPDTATVPSGIETVSSPVYAVSRLHSTLLKVMMNADQLGYEGRYEMLAPVITSLFDTPLICKVILSRYWGDLTETQQADFIDLFNRLSIATYASRFDSYNGEEFRDTGVEELRKGRQLVKTELVRRDKKPVSLDYLIHRSNDKWQIISVIADGVNDLSLKRAEYAAVIKDKGYDGLLEDIQSKIRKMETGT